MSTLQKLFVWFWFFWFWLFFVGDGFFLWLAFFCLSGFFCFVLFLSWPCTRPLKIKEQLRYFLPPHDKQDFFFHLLAGCASSLPRICRASRDAARALARQALHWAPHREGAWHWHCCTHTALVQSLSKELPTKPCTRDTLSTKFLWLSLDFRLELSFH